MTALRELSQWTDDLDVCVKVGCDIVAVEDIENSLGRFGDRFLRRVFAETEIRQCAGVDRIERLAARFAAKEAVIKAFGEPDAAFPLPEIAVLGTEGVPTLELTGTAARRAREHGWLRTSLSLSHGGCHAMAMVAVVCRPLDAEGAVSSPRS